MLATRQAVLRRFWYPAMPVAVMTSTSASAISHLFMWASRKERAGEAKVSANA